MGNNALVTLGSFARPVAPQRHITCLGDNRVRWRSVAVGRSVKRKDDPATLRHPRNHDGIET